MAHSKEEIIRELNRSFSDVANLATTADKYSFELSKHGKWSIGQQLEHLIKSVKPVNMALGLPLFIPNLLFGKRNREARSYDEVVAKYKAILANGAVSTEAYIPGITSFEHRDKLVKEYKLQLEKLAAYINKLSDQQLDSILLPHPLLGKMTIREILFFTIYHTQHHANSMRLAEKD